ncbi:hypothetical protein [Halococcoides cellulosivorans]|uniref:Uncharacterized protein n=1 Tax=Halococcoides cellulosivorans TaxID=1679096 RepID=A0A2R4X047_9EURY|nr:hypothetical protein [Halococcoides cellulosivorans]AWB27149.1 hypothetical protein HARCEL1_05230 [Halococcoides cellulosivorans]
MTQPDTRTVFAGVDTRSNAEIPDWYDSDPDPVPFSRAVRTVSRSIDTDRFDPIDAYSPIYELCHRAGVDGRRLGEITFGEIRTYRSADRVQVDILFDGLEATLSRDEPVTMGLSTRFEDETVSADGFAQDITCTNSMRQLTERSELTRPSRDSLESWWRAHLQEMELVSSRLGNAIEAAQEIETVVEPELVPTLYESIGWPPSLATSAAERVIAETDSESVDREVDTELDESKFLPDSDDEDGAGPDDEDGAGPDAEGGAGPDAEGGAGPDDEDDAGPDAEGGAGPDDNAGSDAEPTTGSQDTETDGMAIDLWTLYSGGTYALTHEHPGSEGATFDEHVRLLNQLLVAPGQAIDLLESDGTTPRTVEAPTLPTTLLTRTGDPATTRSRSIRTTAARTGRGFDR